MVIKFVFSIMFIGRIEIVGMCPLIMLVVWFGFNCVFLLKTETVFCLDYGSLSLFFTP
jgi:hypothetical protein